MTLSMPSIPAGGLATRTAGQLTAGQLAGEGIASTGSPFLDEFLACLTQADAAAEPDAPIPAGMLRSFAEAPALAQNLAADAAVVVPSAAEPVTGAAVSVQPIAPLVVTPLTAAAPVSAPPTANPALSLATDLPAAPQTDLPVQPAPALTALPQAATEGSDATTDLKGTVEQAQTGQPVIADQEPPVLDVDQPQAASPTAVAPEIIELEVTEPETAEPETGKTDSNGSGLAEDALPLLVQDTAAPKPAPETAIPQPAAAPQGASTPPQKAASKAGQGDAPAAPVAGRAAVVQADAVASDAAPLSLAPLASPLVAASPAVAVTAEPLRAASVQAASLGAAPQPAPQNVPAQGLPAKALGGEGKGPAVSHPLPDAPAPLAPPAAADAAVAPVAEGAVDPAASIVAPSAASATAAPPPVVMTDRADWPQTVVSATLAELTPDGGTMTLELAPEELGALRIVLTLEGDSASVQIQTETPEAARLLNEAQRHLAQDFARQGVTLSSHDAQSGRRDEPGTGGTSRSGRQTEQDPSTDLAAPMRLTGTINLLA